MMSIFKTKPKILLVVSPNYSIKILQEEVNNLKSGESDFTKSVDWRVTAPLGILYITGSLRRAGYDVQIYDLHRAFYLCRKIGYFKENDLSDFFKDYFENILKNNPVDVLGISCLFNVASTTVKKMGTIAKKISPNTKIVIGGHYPTCEYYKVLEKGVCDYIILGEAEEEFVWLLNHINDPFLNEKISKNPHIVSIECKNDPDKKPAIIENLDSLAMP
ncbi:cobalamin B12-binding domain-containing protein, partial [Patescibacteria group bacterium]|nr:cobalamin B12-binding domain-containing protein [Patescibacteria group bacterium]